VAPRHARAHHSWCSAVDWVQPRTPTCPPPHHRPAPPPTKRATFTACLCSLDVGGCFLAPTLLCTNIHPSIYGIPSMLPGHGVPTPLACRLPFLISLSLGLRELRGCAHGRALQHSTNRMTTPRLKWVTYRHRFAAYVALYRGHSSSRILHQHAHPSPVARTLLWMFRGSPTRCGNADSAHSRAAFCAICTRWHIIPPFRRHAWHFSVPGRIITGSAGTTTLTYRCALHL